MNLLLPNQERLVWVQRLIWLLLAVLGLDLLSQMYGFLLYGQLKGGTAGVWSTLHFERLATIWNGVRLTALVAVVAAFMAWWYRMTANYVRLGHPMSETPLMMAVWWFLPLFGWFRPFSFMLEAAALPTGYAPASIRHWWGLWLLGIALSALAFAVRNAARLPAEFQLAIFFRSVGDTALILSGLLLPPLMTFVQQGQERLAASLPSYTLPNS